VSETSSCLFEQTILWLKDIFPQEAKLKSMCHTLGETSLFFSHQKVQKNFEQKANHVLTFGLRFLTTQYENKTRKTLLSDKHAHWQENGICKKYLYTVVMRSTSFKG